MKCKRRDLVIAKLAGGDLPEWRAARLQQHLDVCPRCKALHAEIATNRVEARNTHLNAKPVRNDSVVDAVLVRVADRDSHGHGRGVRIRVAGGAVLAAVLIGIVLLQLPVAERSLEPSLPAPPPIAMTSDVPESVDLAALEHSDVVIRMVTNNPDVVILWLGDSAGDL